MLPVSRHLRRFCLADYGQPCDVIHRGPTVHNVATLPEENQATATANMSRKFREV